MFESGVSIRKSCFCACLCDDKLLKHFLNVPDAGFEPSRRALLPVAGERRSDQWRGGGVFWSPLICCLGEIENRTPDAGFEPSRRALLPVAGERRSDQWREVACFGRLLYVVWGDRK